MNTFSHPTPSAGGTDASNIHVTTENSVPGVALTTPGPAKTYQGGPDVQQSTRLAAGDASPNGWIEDSACRTLGSDLFFSYQKTDIAKAKAVCRNCPVRTQCLNVALADEINMDGIWGGLDFDERAKLRRKPGALSGWGRDSSLPREHGTERGYQQHRNHDPACNACKRAHYLHNVALERRKAA